MIKKIGQYNTPADTAAMINYLRSNFEAFYQGRIRRSTTAIQLAGSVNTPALVALHLQLVNDIRTVANLRRQA